MGRSLFKGRSHPFRQINPTVFKDSMRKALTASAVLEQTPNHIHIELSKPHLILSSAVLNGGLVQADHLLNMKVPKTGECAEVPEKTLSDYAVNNSWQGTTVGMMTAASMDSLRLGKIVEQGIEIAVMVTSGLSNPRRVGDFAEHRLMAAHPDEVGTINIAVFTSAVLTSAALVEALMIATEAKTAALEEAGTRSPVSNKIATGTGTDSIAVVSGHGPEIVNYCGKHVLFGELLGGLVLEAVASSINWDPVKACTKRQIPSPPYN